MAELRETEDEGWPQEVGRRIVQTRKELGMSQIELAELVHVSERSMQAYESGEVVPYRKIRDLSEVLGRPTSWILHGEAAQATAGDLAPLLREISEKLDRIVAALEQRG